MILLCSTWLMFLYALFLMNVPFVFAVPLASKHVSDIFSVESLEQSPQINHSLFEIVKTQRSTLLSANKSQLKLMSQSDTNSSQLKLVLQSDPSSSHLKPIPESDLAVESANPVQILQSNPVQILQSKSDKMSYRYLKLKNGLPVLLISDPTTSHGAAAMDIGSGYYSDPTPGLAHFLEHMLFLGSDKYKDERQYSECLNQHGGTENAYTSSENTNFYVSLTASGLMTCLDMWAQFFISPLLSADAIQREMNAVNSEHAKNLQTDAWRIQALRQNLARPESPYHKFGTGNLKTLANVKRDELAAFWAAHYHASNMRLVVLGMDTLDTLENNITSMFSVVPQSPSKTTSTTTTTTKTTKTTTTTTTITKKFIHQSVPLLQIHNKLNQNGDEIPDAMPSVYLPKVLGSVVNFNTVMDIKPLILTWTLPPQLHHYREKSVEFLTTLISTTGEGSLQTMLKNQGWISELSAGAVDDTSLFQVVEVSLLLTEAGLNQKDAIIQLIFDHLALIKEKAIEDWRYKEMGAINMLAFDYKSKEEPMNYVSTLANNLHNVEPKDVLSCDFLYEKFSPSHIHSIIELLVPERMIVYHGQKNPSEALPHTEPWYGINYSIKPLTSEQKQMFVQPPPKIVLKLPEKNVFIPEDLSIKTLSKLQQKENIKIPNAATPFILFEQSKPSVRVWFRQDNSFKLPHGQLNVKLWSGMVHSNPRSTVLAELYSRLFQNSLETFMDAPSHVGFMCSVQVSKSGIELHLSGYNDKFTTFANGVFQKMGHASFLQNSQTNTQQFITVKQSLQESLQNSQFQMPYSYIFKVTRDLLHPSNYHPLLLEHALKSLTLDDVAVFEEEFRSDLQLELLLHGNFLPHEAKKFSDVILTNFPYDTQVTSFSDSQSRTGHEGVFRTRLVQLPKGFTKVVSPHPNPNEKNNVVYTMFQLDEGNDIDTIYGNLVSRVLQQEIYAQLRTKQQLGYVVWSSDQIQRFSSRSVNSFWMLVMSSVYDASTVQDRMLKVLPNLQEFIKDMTALDEMGNENPKFLKFKNSFQKDLEKNFTDLPSWTEHLWGEISSSSLQFDRNAVLCDILVNNDINGAGLNEFFGRYMNARTLSVQITGHNKPKTNVSNSTLLLVEKADNDPVNAVFKTCPGICPNNMFPNTIETSPENISSVLSLAVKENANCNDEISVPIDRLNAKFVGELFLFPLPELKDPPPKVSPELFEDPDC